jgi:fumarate hydratase, class II
VSQSQLPACNCELRWARRPSSLGDASEKLRRYRVAGAELDRDKITDYVDRALMLVTAFSPHMAPTRLPRSRTRPNHEGATI